MNEKTLVDIQAELLKLEEKAAKLIANFRDGAYGLNNLAYAHIKNDLILILHQFGPVANDLLNVVKKLPNSVNSAELQAAGELGGCVLNAITISNKLLSGQLTSGNKPFIPSKFSNKVFIVHGHDQQMLQNVSAFIKKIGLEPIILHEQPNKGRTIIEKFVDYSDVGFSVVLLSPDDKALENEKQILRARQNVIFELGYFLGKLGRDRVVALYKNSVQIPSDYNGVLYVEYNSADSWKLQVGKELKAVDFSIDFNLIFD